MASVKVKKENFEDRGPEDGHHQFDIQFESDKNKYTIDCDRPTTVLEAIKSQYEDKYRKLACSDENIIIKLGEGQKAPIIPTHFPCCLVEAGECLIISKSRQTVEAKNTDNHPILPKENYSVFLIDREGGENAKSKRNLIFRNTNIRVPFGFFSVYGEKGKTVEDALRQDGRFVDDISDFTLSDLNQARTFTPLSAKVDTIHKKKFAICLPMQERNKENHLKRKARNKHDFEAKCIKVEQEPASGDPEHKRHTRPVLDKASKNGINLRAAMTETSCRLDLKEIYELLCQQSSGLKKIMEERFPGKTFKTVVDQKKENFGKIQGCFSEVQTIREMVDLSDSVCLLKVRDSLSHGVQGTGFMLFGQFILTNAHLFDEWRKNCSNDWRQFLTITAHFNFENPQKPGIELKAVLVHGDMDLDFALLELDPGMESPPPGLLQRFGPLPSDDGACIIGHPAGEVKKMDITCVIKPEDREQAVNKNLDSYKDHIFTVYSINNEIKRDPLADIRVTYNSFMYHGSSGSPVIDSSGRVFGLHSGGFFYGLPKAGESVLEFAFPLLEIFKKLLQVLKNTNNEKLLAQVLLEAKGNPFLESLISSVCGSDREVPKSDQP